MTHTYLDPNHKVVPLRYAHFLLGMIAILAVALILALAFLPANDHREVVPRCQEDEVIVRADFPSGDLTCIHIDELP